MKINYNKKNKITNFREICMGNMKSGVIYRSSYPIFKIDKKRDETYTELVLEAGINCVINLAGNVKDIETLASLVPLYNTLYKNNNYTGELEFF